MIAPPCHTRTFASTDDWITPRWIIDKLGPFDLDPCACIPQPWPCAKRSYTICDGGLTRHWEGMVWMNPPYGNQTARWLERLADHSKGIALVFARTETRMFFDHVWPKADSILFLKGRLTFHRSNGSTSRKGGNSGGPSVLIAYGNDATARLARSMIPGKLIRL